MIFVFNCDADDQLQVLHIYAAQPITRNIMSGRNFFISNLMWCWLRRQAFFEQENCLAAVGGTTLVSTVRGVQVRFSVGMILGAGLSALVFANLSYAQTPPTFSWKTEFKSWNELYKAQKYADAEKAMLAGLKRLDAGTTAERDEYLPTTLNSLIYVYYAQNKLVPAEPIFNRYLMLMHRQNGPNSPEMATALQNYAALLRKIGRGSEASDAEERAKTILAAIESAKAGIATDDFFAKSKAGGAPAGVGPRAGRTAPPSAVAHGSGAGAGGGDHGGLAELTDSDFDSTVLNSSTPTVVDFYATWCGPCKRMHPVMVELARSYAGRVNIVQVDVDKSPETSGKYEVHSMPTFMIFKGGQPVARSSGACAREEMTSWIDANI
jgi:thioredoxin 1